MSSTTPKEQARSCLVKLYTQAFYHDVANGGPQSVANYRIARAKVDNFGSLAVTALERYLEDCPHDADSVKVDIVLDDQYFRLHPCDSLSLLEKGEVTHVILSLPPRLSRSARAASVSRAASVTRAASTRATTPPSKNQRRRSSTVQPASASTKIQTVIISDTDRDSEDTSAAHVPKRTTAKTRRSSLIDPQTSKGRAQVPKDAEVLSISSDVDEDADDEATQKPETRGQSPVKRGSRRENGTKPAAKFKHAAPEAMQQSRPAELAGTKGKTSKVMQKAMPEPRSASINDPWEVPSSEEDLQVKQERTTPFKAKSRAPVMSATPGPRPARPPSSKPTTPAAIPSDAKIISIADTSSADESVDPDVPSVRCQASVSRQANGSGDRGLITRNALLATEKKNGKRPMQHRINENITFMSPATGSGNAEEGRAGKPPIAPRFSVANSRGVFPLYPKRGLQPEALKATRPPSSSAPAKSSVSKSRVTSTPDTLEVIEQIRAESDCKKKEWEAEKRKEKSKKASATAKPESISVEAAIASLVGNRRAPKKKPEPVPVNFLNEPEYPDDDMSEIIHPPASLQGTRKTGGGSATDSAFGSQTSTQRSTVPTTSFTPINEPAVTFTSTFRKLKYSGADFKPMNTLNPKPAKPQSPPPTSSTKFSSYPLRFQEVFSDPESSEKEEEAQPDSVQEAFSYPESTENKFSDKESSDNEKESQSDSEASVTSRGSNGERRFHVEELADDGLPKAFKAWQVKYGSIFRSEPDLPYLYIDDGPWEGLVVDGQHMGKYITGCRPPSADLIADMARKTVPRFPDLCEAADFLGKENDDGGHEEAVLPPIGHGRRATPPSSWSDESHIRQQLERECPPSNQELGILMSSSPARKMARERQTPRLEQTPSQRTRSKVVDWEEELNVTPDTERAMSQVETPQTKSRASALKNAKIVVEISEPPEAQRAEYKKMPEVNAQVLASGLKRLSDINDKSENIATASQESGLAVVDHVMSESPVWLKTVDLSDFQTDTAPETAGKRLGSIRKLAAETPSRPSTHITTSSPLKRKGSLYEKQKDTALPELSSSIPSEDLSSMSSDSPRKSLKSHAQDSPTKYFTRSSARQRASEPKKRKAASLDEPQESPSADATLGDVAADSPRKAPKLHAHKTPHQGPVRDQEEPPESTSHTTQPPKESKKKSKSRRGSGVGTQVTRRTDDAQSLAQAREKDIPMTQRRRERRKRFKAKNKNK